VSVVRQCDVDHRSAAGDAAIVGRKPHRCAVAMGLAEARHLARARLLSEIGKADDGARRPKQRARALTAAGSGTVVLLLRGRGQPRAPDGALQVMVQS
jgi:hypothetical protein